MHDFHLDMTFYALKGREVLTFTDAVKWAEYCVAQGDAYTVHVGDTVVGDVRVSTVLLSSPSFSFNRDRPLMFETMVFGTGDNDITDMIARYATYDEAEQSHRAIVASLQVLESETIEVSRAMIAILRTGIHHSREKND